MVLVDLVVSVVSGVIDISCFKKLLTVLLTVLLVGCVILIPEKNELKQVPVIENRFLSLEQDKSIYERCQDGCYIMNETELKQLIKEIRNGLGVPI